MQPLIYLYNLNIFGTNILLSKGIGETLKVENNENKINFLL